MRREARENRQRLLEAADDLFARKGSSASVAEIVAAAGVGAPTLYRHFGTKEGLVRAIGEMRSADVTGQLARAVAEPRRIDGIRVAIELHLEMARTNRAVREISGAPLPPGLEKMMIAAWGTLIDGGHAEGTVRLDFAPTDFPFFLAAIAAVARTVEYDPALQGRYLELFMQSLSPGSQTRLPGRPPTAQRIRKAFAPRDAAAR